MSIYDTLIQEIIAEERQRADVQGILLIGSVARGDMLPGSDLDMRIIVTEGITRPFLAETRQGILVERGYADRAKAEQKLATNPMEAYAYLDGRILYDPHGLIAQLTEQARKRFAEYRVGAEECREIAYWLHSVQIKLQAAVNAGDLLKAAYIQSTASWPLLRGLWAANERPLPPNGAVWYHLRDLSSVPDHIEEQLRTLFCGETQQRIQSMLDLLAWILARLQDNQVKTT